MTTQSPMLWTIPTRITRIKRIRVWEKTLRWGIYYPAKASDWNDRVPESFRSSFGSDQSTTEVTGKLGAMKSRNDAHCLPVRKEYHDEMSGVCLNASILYHQMLTTERTHVVRLPNDCTRFYVPYLVRGHLVFTFCRRPELTRGRAWR